MSGDTQSLNPNALTRFFLEVRLLLIGFLLLLLPTERLSLSIILITASSAVLTWLAIHYWSRLERHIVRRPSLIAADAFIVSVLLALDGPTGPLFMATILTSTIAGIVVTTRAITGVAIVQVLCYFAALLYHVLVDGSVQPFMTFQILVIQPALYPLAGLAGVRLNRLFRTLADEQEARRTAERRTAIAEERARLARDMHDSVSKTLRAATLGAQALPLWVQKDPERATSTAAQIAEAVETAHKETRALLNDLRNDGVEKPISDHIRELVDAWAAHTEIAARFSSPGPSPELMVRARHETVAILNEVLSNIEKHANATSVSVSLGSDGRYATLTVRDNGHGFDPEPYRATDNNSPSAANGHYGILGIRERASHADGAIAVDSAPGMGTEITLRVPVVDNAGIPATGIELETPAEA